MADAEMLEVLVWAALDGWAGARHEVDSYYLIVQEVPDWKEKLARHLNDPFRQHMTNERFAPLRKAVTAMINGEEGRLVLEQALAAIKKSPN